jgi:hypothetical protein
MVLCRCSSLLKQRRLAPRRLDAEGIKVAYVSWGQSRHLQGALAGVTVVALVLFPPRMICGVSIVQPMAHLT